MSELFVEAVAVLVVAFVGVVHERHVRGSVCSFKPLVISSPLTTSGAASIYVGMLQKTTMDRIY